MYFDNMIRQEMRKKLGMTDILDKVQSGLPCVRAFDFTGPPGYVWLNLNDGLTKIAVYC